MAQKPNKWGGKRQNAGRPKTIINQRDRTLTLSLTEIEKELLLKKHINSRGVVNFLLNNL